MSFCPRCGSSVSVVARFCPSCGMQLEGRAVTREKPSVAKRNRNWVIWAVPVVALAVLIISLFGGNNAPDSNSTTNADSDSSTSSMTRASTDSPRVTPGKRPTVAPSLMPSPSTPTTIMSLDGGLNAADVVVVGAKPLPCFDSTDAVGAFLQADGVGDKTGEQEALQSATVISPGDHLLVIDSSMSPPGSGALRFRVTSGTNAGAACWLPGSLYMSEFASVTHATLKN